MSYFCIICSWVGLVSKNYEIERACVELEKELTELETKHRQKKVSMPHRRETDKVDIWWYHIWSCTSRTFLALNFNDRFRVRLVWQNKFWTFLKQFFSPRFWRQPTFFPLIFGLLSVINDNSTVNLTIVTVLQCIRQCCIKLSDFYLYLA